MNTAPAIEVESTRTELAVVPKDNGSMVVAAPLSVDDIVAQVTLIQNVMHMVMKDGEHYGTIPGCGDKKALLQPGAQKLTMTFRLAPEYAIQEGNLERGHKEYRVICTLKSIQTGVFVGQGVGVCSTMEGKYRFRNAGLKCPNCGKESILRSKNPGEGFFCWAKKGGCGAKFAANSPQMVGQSPGRTEHDNPADHFNTVLKMAKKRAFVDATITATAASDIFTQDIGDSEGGDDNAQPEAPAPAGRAATPQTHSDAPSSARRVESSPVKPSIPQYELPVEGEGVAKRTFKNDKERREALEAHVELCKAKFIKQLQPVGAVAVEYFRSAGLLLPTDTELSQVNVLQLFPSVDWNETPDDNNARIRADRDRLMRGCKEFMDGGSPHDDDDDQIPGAEVEEEEEEEAHVPRDPDANLSNEGWRSVVVPFGAQKGTPLEGLEKPKLWGWWCNFKVSATYEGKDGKTYTKKPEQIAADTEFRRALDAAGVHYEFVRKD